MRILDVKESLGVRDGGCHLQPVAHDSGVGEKPSNVLWPVSGNNPGIEAVKSADERLALAQYRRPGEPGLETLEDEALKQGPVIVTGDAPLLIVIGDHQGVSAGPFATDEGGGVAG